MFCFNEKLLIKYPRTYLGDLERFENMKVYFECGPCTVDTLHTKLLSQISTKTDV